MRKGVYDTWNLPDIENKENQTDDKTLVNNFVFKFPYIRRFFNAAL